MASRDPDRPNVVFVLSDDQGPWAMGCAGNGEIQTPTLDALAARGTRLENFFCASPVCSPARASLLTGQIPSRHGVHDYLFGTDVGPAATDYLSGQVAFTDVLAEAGYRLGLSGKWHLGANDRPRPGFVHWYAHRGGGSPYYDAPMYRGGRPETVPGYLTDALADDAIDFLDAEADRGEPFLLSLHFTAPHSPWAGQHPDEVTARYADCAFDSCPQGPLHPWTPLDQTGRPLGGESDTRAALVGYFAAVTAMDAALGRVLDRLDGCGLTTSTMVVFSSDNGFNAGHHGVWGKGNGTYPQNMYDSSVKVPAIIAQPGRIGVGVCDELLSAYDLGATVLELAGVPHETLEVGPGRSFAGLLRPGAPPGTGRDRVVVFDEYGPVRMIRTPRWKYVHRHPDGPHELYDLDADPGEAHNLVSASEQRQIVTGLRGELEDWFRSYADPAYDGATLPVIGTGQRARVGEPDAFQGPLWVQTAGSNPK